MEEETEELEIDFSTRISRQDVIYGFVGVIFLSLIIGAALGHSASPDDEIKQGITEVCHKFGAEEAVSASYSGTRHSGNLTVNCAVSGDSLDLFEITIPVQQVSAQVSGYEN